MTSNAGNAPLTSEDLRRQARNINMTTNYIRGYQFPSGVAFKVKELFKKDDTNRALLHHSDNVQILFFLPAKFSNMSDAFMKAVNDEISADKYWYFYSKGLIGDNAAIDLIAEEERDAKALPIFDCTEHVIAKPKREHEQASSSSNFSPKKFKPFQE